MIRIRPRLLTAILAISPLAGAAGAQSLRGSLNSVEEQYGVAVRHDFTFLDTATDVTRFAKLGLLVPLRGNANYQLAGVSYPYARPAVRTFVERLASQHMAACNERLVVTSLTRPASQQPRNASDGSVHPAGMAVDLRRSTKQSCRVWLERTLLSLEKRGVLDATRELRPPHYHVAIFPTRYLAYVERQIANAAPLASAPQGR